MNFKIDGHELRNKDFHCYILDSVDFLDLSKVLMLNPKKKKKNRVKREDDHDKNAVKWTF